MKNNEATCKRRISVDMKIDREAPKEEQSAVNRRLSLDLNSKVPAPKSFTKVLSQLLDEEDVIKQEVAYERRVNKSNSTAMLISPDVEHHDPAIIGPLNYSSRTSRLNPENNFSSKTREEMRLSLTIDMRLSPHAQPPKTNKRKCTFIINLVSSDSDKQLPDHLFFKPIKRLYKAPMILRSQSVPPSINIERSFSASSHASSEMKISPEDASPKLALGALPLNLTAAGANFSNMKLH
jgi:hypothetical protein